MNNYQRFAIFFLALGATLIGVGYGTSVNSAINPVPIAELGLTPEAVTATQEAVADMPALQVVGADSDDDNRAKRVNLHVAIRDLNGGWSWHGPQETGDCNAFATCLSAEIDLANAIKNGADFEWKLMDRPWAYYGGRVRNGRVQLSGDGSVPAWSAEWFRDKGILWAEYGGEYSGSRSNSWGKKGPPQSMYEKAAPYRIESFAKMNDAQDVCNAICAGYPVLFGSMKWGTNSITLVEGRNVARDTTNWPHAEAFVAYDGTTSKYGKEGLWRVMNSWGPNAHNPKSTLADDAPGGYYVTKDVVDMICREGMAFSISGTSGFPKRDLNFDVFGAAVVPVEKEDAMFQISTEAIYGLGGLALAISAVLFVAGRLRGNVPRWAGGAAMFTMVVMLSGAVRAQDLNFEVITNPSMTSISNDIDGLNFAVFTTDTPVAVASILRSDPLKFDVDCRCPDDCDCKGTCKCALKALKPEKSKPEELKPEELKPEELKPKELKPKESKPAESDDKGSRPTATPAKFPMSGVYSSGGHRQNWSMSGGDNATTLRAHIMQEHGASKYNITSQWLSTLSLSQLRHLHSDLHEGTVNREMLGLTTPVSLFSKGSTSQVTAAKPAQSGRWMYMNVCNGGSCSLRRVWVAN